MANKRTLKSCIKLITEELFAEAVAAALYGNEPNQDNTEALLFSIIKTQNDYISRISHPEPGIAANVYYKDLREKFYAEVGDIVDQINNL